MTTVPPPRLVQLGRADTVAALVWRLDDPQRCLSTAAVGGGAGDVHWVVNAQVPDGYARTDLDAYVGELAGLLGLEGRGVGLLTAADVATMTTGADGGVVAHATVGLTHPTWAAAEEARGETAGDPGEAAGESDASRPGEAGTINLVVWLPERHGDGALANLLCTVTEAKVQALLAGGVPGTGTPSDAVTVLCPTQGAAEPFGGPRSRFGAGAARSTYAAVTAGLAAWRRR